LFLFIYNFVGQRIIQAGGKREVMFFHTVIQRPSRNHIFRQVYVQLVITWGYDAEKEENTNVDFLLNIFNVEVAMTYRLYVHDDVRGRNTAVILRRQKG